MNAELKWCRGNKKPRITTYTDNKTPEMKIPDYMKGVSLDKAMRVYLACLLPYEMWKDIYYPNNRIHEEKDK